jgi:hypothetical protein
MKQAILPVVFFLGFVNLAFAQTNNRVLFRSPGTGNGPVSIAGTRINIQPPPGFLSSLNFTGLENGKSLIEMYDLVGGAYQVVSQDFTMEKFRSQGIEVHAVEDVTIDGYGGRLIALRNYEGQDGLTLVFGDDSFSAIIVANYPLQHPTLGNVIRESLLGIRYDKFGTGEMLSGAAFRIDDSHSSFRLQRKSANTFYFLRGNDDGAGKPYMAVTQLAWDHTTSPSTIGDLMLAEMKKYGLENPDIRKRSRTKVNGYPAYESEIYATRRGEKCLIYQMVVVHDAKAIVVHGIGNSDYRKNKDEFKKLARSIRFM